MPAVPRLEGERAVGRRGARVELPRLGDRAARELGAADPGREAEVVLDPARRPGLAAERGALDDQRVEAFGGAVDRGREPRRAGADDQQVDLLARRELEPDPEGAQHLAGASDRAALLRRAAARAAARRPSGGAASCQVYGSRFARAKSSIRIVGSEACGPTISRPIPSHALQRLAPGDERGEEEVAERAVLVEERAQRGALDRDVPQRLGHERVDEDRLPRQEVQLAEEARRAVPDELVPGGVDDRDLSFEDRDERIGPIADPVQQLTDRRRALLADLGESRQLRRGEQWARGC